MWRILGAIGQLYVLAESLEGLVLIGEHLCGGHQRGLPSFFDRAQHAVSRDHGLPRPHVAVEQALAVLVNGDHVVLGFGESLKS